MISILGFIIAAYSVIGNDVIQTLGTFIQSNEKKPWWKLFIYIGSILTVVLIIGWILNSGDAAYGRLDKITRPETMTIWYLLPPLILLIITRFGIPVSTTFLILSVFSTQVILMSILMKSFFGYVIGFLTAFISYRFVLLNFEKEDATGDVKNKKLWTILQWASTAFLWSQWLIQDFANLYVYLPPRLDLVSMLLSLLVMLFILAIILMRKGGKIQKVVSTKTNSSNIRSATIIDFIYGGVLLIFTTASNIPMSTTWTFVGILAGREIALRSTIFRGTIKLAWKMVGLDFLKVTIGILISLAIVLVLRNSGLIG